MSPLSSLPVRISVAAAIALGGCGQTMTEADCDRIGKNLEVVWLTESRKSAPPDGSAAERAEAVIKAEGEKLATDWNAECRRDLLGRRVEGKQMQCLLSAKSIDEIRTCRP